MMSPLCAIVYCAPLARGLLIIREACRVCCVFPTKCLTQMRGRLHGTFVDIKWCKMQKLTGPDPECPHLRIGSAPFSSVDPALLRLDRGWVTWLKLRWGAHTTDHHRSPQMAKKHPAIAMMQKVCKASRLRCGETMRKRVSALCHLCLISDIHVDHLSFGCAPSKHTW